MSCFYYKTMIGGLHLELTNSRLLRDQRPTTGMR